MQKSARSPQSSLTSERIREHRPVMPIPLALESLLRIVLLFEPEELRELWITRLHLRARRMPMVRQIVAAAAANRHIDQPPERRRRVFPTLRRMRDMQVENHAGVPLLRPRKKR